MLEADTRTRNKWGRSVVDAIDLIPTDIRTKGFSAIGAAHVQRKEKDQDDSED